jgi:hypothetical protein
MGVKHSITRMIQGCCIGVLRHHYIVGCVLLMAGRGPKVL